MSDDAEPPFRFSNEAKLRKQMRRRGWTDAMIVEALATAPEPWAGKLGPALRYTHPATGKKLLIDATTGEVFHVGTERFKYD
jgi:hypothetical protein